jgi:hypothetical protein
MKIMRNILIILKFFLFRYINYYFKMFICKFTISLWTYLQYYIIFKIVKFGDGSKPNSVYRTVVDGRNL